jgi:Concanavalin A-like lectin/glucanases superfamily
VAADSSGNGHNLTYQGSPTFGQPDPITDDVDGAVLFPSASWIGDPLGDADTTAAFTIAVWFRHAAVSLATNSYVAAWTNVAGSGNTVVMGGTGSAFVGKIGVSTVGGGFTTAARYDDDAWHFLVLVSDSTNGRLYIDGADVSGAFSSAGPHVIGQVTIGGWPLLGDAYSFGGSIDEVAFWNRALTGTEVADIYATRNAGLGDTTGGRITRVADYIELPAALRAFDTGDSTMTSAGDMDGQSAVEAMRLAETTEAGWLFCDRSGILTFLERSAVQGGLTRASEVQASYTDEMSGVESDDDVMEMANVVVNQGRNTITAVLTDDASILDNGRVTRNLSTAPQTAREVTDRAQWEAAIRADPTAMRIRRLTFDVAADNAATIMAREVMDRVNVTWTPPPGEGTPFDQDTLVQGIETQSDRAWDFWQVTFDLSPTDTLGVFRWGVDGSGWGQAPWGF